MANEYTSGAFWSNTMPDWQRDYYSLLLLETLRQKSILVPYCARKTDYAGANSGVAANHAPVAAWPGGAPRGR